jgi:uncharacterized membrane protein YgdD (TMEM256/DUF423 family)
MYHALALLACGFVAVRIDNLPVRIAGAAFVAGTVLFSGSLYALAFGSPRWMGMITPLGGVGFIAGWLALACSTFTTTAS